MKKKPIFIVYFIMFAVFLWLDRFLKNLVMANMQIGEAIPAQDAFFAIRYTINTGVSFSLLSGHVEALIALQSILFAAVFAACIVTYRKLRHPVLQTGLVWVVTGGAGNLIDRIMYGHVIDFISVGSFPVWNFADMCIVGGCILLGIFILFIYGRFEKKQPENAGDKKAVKERTTETLYIDTSEYEDREAVFGEEDAGKRLDVALAERFPDLSRSRIQQLLESGLVRPEGKTKNSRVKTGDIITISVNERIPLSAEPEDIEIDVVYEDDDVVVVDKPRGMVVHPAKGNATGTLVNALLWRYSPGDDEGLSRVNGDIRPGIVHRIDKNTSGLLVVAKNDAAHESLASQFAAHTVGRSYRAIVVGGFKKDEGTIDAPIGRNNRNRLKQAVDPNGKRAVTHWRLNEKCTGRHGTYSLLDVELETGRTHQIRVHMASKCHPVLGDDLYGGKGGIAAEEGQYLHACTLSFDHPATGERLSFESPLPDYFADMLSKLR